MKEMKLVMHGALLLTIASFITKLLSAAYRVPFQNIVGNEGFYAYQQVYPFYGVGMTLALSGLPVFLSKLVAESKENKEEHSVMQQLYPLTCLLSFGLFLSIFVSSGWLAQAMGDPHLTEMLQVVSFIFLLVPGLSFRRGIFQGNLYVAPTGLSQIVEQLLRVGTILLSAWAFARFHWSIYQMGTVAMLGSLIGGLAAYFLLCLYQRKNATLFIPNYVHFFKFRPSKRLIRRFFLEGGMVCLYSAFMVLFQLVDSFTVKKTLVEIGMNDTSAKIIKGVYDRGQPLVQLGLVMALAMSSAFLPVLTKYYVQKRKKDFLKASSTYIKITGVVASAASVGLIMLMQPINFILFGDTEGSNMLQLFVLSILFMALIYAYQNISQSLMNIVVPLQAAFIGIVVKILLTQPMVKSWQGLGASASTMVALLACFVFLLWNAPMELKKLWSNDYFLIKLFVIVAAMAASLFVYQNFLRLLGISQVENRWHSFIQVSLGGIMAASVLLYGMIQADVFTLREWLTIPFGKKVLRIKRKKSDNNEIR